MRFVRAYARVDTGEILAVAEQETPFPERYGLRQTARDFEIEMHELGLAHDFQPMTIDGAKCSPSMHLFQRLELVQGEGEPAIIDPTATALSRFRAKVGHEEELPVIMDVPTTLEGLKRRHATRPLPANCRAWLTLMLPPHEVDAMELDDAIPLSVLKALDDMRMRRDPSLGSRKIVLERLVEKRAAAASARRVAASTEAQAAIEVLAARERAKP